VCLFHVESSRAFAYNPDPQIPADSRPAAVPLNVMTKHLFASFSGLHRGFYAAALVLIGGCSGIEKAPPQSTSAKIDRSFVIDVPEIMRGTIASETVVLGYESTSSENYRPVIARGYGLVVGLNGSGAADIPPTLRAHMLDEAAKGGFGSEQYGPEIAGLTPEQLLNSEDTAVVVVEAVIPQGAVKGTRFDVRVYPAPGTQTTSLEGGRLYSTLLRPGELKVGGGQAFELAKARGPVFVNPFAEPGAIGRDTVVRTVGRVLNGGEVVRDMPIKLRLANPSHQRAAIVITAVNTRFAQEPGQRAATARGESDELIEITVPPSYLGRTDEFLDLLRHSTVLQSNPEAAATFVKRTLLANPLVAEAASLRWQALGARVLPLIKDLYDYVEEVPRLAALKTAANLDDALAVPHLVKMSREGTPDNKLIAIKLLGDMQLNPQIDMALRQQLDDPDVEVRLESYEALLRRRDPAMRRFAVDDKFVIDIVDSKQPLIYITQIGQPRIVLFGSGTEVRRPLSLFAWSNRLMMKADSGDEELEVFYRSPSAQQGMILKSSPVLENLVSFFGHETSIERPEPGLGLSYSETVGAIHELWRNGFIAADFKAEQDRILAAILRRERETDVPDRPEFADGRGANEGTGGAANPDDDTTPPANSGSGDVQDLGDMNPDDRFIDPDKVVPAQPPGRPR